MFYVPFLLCYSFVVALLIKNVKYVYKMALLQFTALIAGIQGKLQGSVISRGRSGNVIYNRPTQRREPTKFQLGIRAGFASASYAWKQLSPALKLDWLTISTNNPVPNRFSDLVVLSGFDYFKKMLGLTFPLGVSAPIIPNLSVSQPYQHSPVSASASFSITNEGFVLDSYFLEFTTINDSSFDNLVNVYISLPVPGFDEPYYKTWYLVSQFQVLANQGPDEPIYLAGNNVLMPSGWRAFADSPILFKTVAFIPSTGKISVDQIYPFVISSIPVPVFPTFQLITSGGDSYFVRRGINTSTFGVFWNLISGTINSIDFWYDLDVSEPQSDFSPVSPSAWTNFQIQADIPFFNLILFQTPVSGGFITSADAYMSSFPSVMSIPLPAYIPVRIRLFSLISMTYDSWVTGFVEIEQG